MNIDDMIIVNMNFSETVGSIERGDVDAVVSFQPYTDEIKTLLGDDVVVWPAQASQWWFTVLSARNDWIDYNTDLIVRILRALDQSNTYISQHPQEARLILKKHINMTTETLETVLQRNCFSLTLDQSLLAVMEDETRWMIQNNLTVETQVPNFHDYIYKNPLKSIKPEAVNLIQ